MNNNKDLDHAFKIGTVGLTLSGVTTTDLKVNKYLNIFVRRWLFYFNLLWLQTDLAAFVFWIFESFKKGTSILELCSMAPNITICEMNVAKITPLFFNTDILETLMDMFREMHPVNKGKSTIKGNAEESVKLIRLVGIILIVTFTLVAGAFLMFPIIQMTYNFLETGGTDFILPFRGFYYIDMDKTANYVLVFFHQVFSTAIAGANLIGFEASFSAYCTLIRMHFRILSYRFENEIPFGPGMSLEKLMELVLRHKKILRLGEQMNTVFSKSTLAHMLLGSVLIAVCLFNLAFTQNLGNIISYFLFLIMSTTQIFVMCYFGDMLLTSSAEFSQAVYNCGWYKADVRGRKFILFVLMRSQIPCKITAAGYADLRMTTFTSILTSAWSYFALLRTMIGK